VVAGLGPTEAFLLTTGLVLLLLVLVGPVELTAEEAAIQGCTVDHHRVLLIVATIRHNCNDDVEPDGILCAR
jgi:hypothetical protein